MQIAFDFTVGFILPTEVTMVFKITDDQHISEIRKSLGSIFFNGNNTIPKLKNFKTSGDWHKATFKIFEPIKFKSNFQLFKKQNKGLTVFEDIKRKSLRSYAPYAGFLGVLLNIVQFRDSIWL